MPTEKVKKFRQRHHKCVFCRHLDKHTVDAPCVPEVWWCRAKLRSVTIGAAYRARPFCSCYEQPDKSEKENT